MRIIDLSMPIAAHFRWRTQVSISGDNSQGKGARVTRLDATCHGFSHVDARAHILPDAPTIEATPLSRVVGPCRVLDLRDARPEEAIDAARLSRADPGGKEGEILLLSTGWDRERDFNTAAFWKDSPYVTRDGAEWLLARRPTAVAFDFPQDYPIRLLLDGESFDLAENPTHDVLLRANVTLIEYLVNTAALAGPRCFLSAAPLLIPDADGAPARVYAIEGLAV
jgi:arylformamidase